MTAKPNLAASVAKSPSSSDAIDLLKELRTALIFAAVTGKVDVWEWVT